MLQRDFGFRAADDFNAATAQWWDSRELFLHGLLDGMPGCCSNLPVLYAAIGRRLNYPLRLVPSPFHLFVRWDDPGTGERFNIEATTRGLASYPDDYYLSWPRETPPQAIAGKGYLESLRPREELATILILRTACLVANGRLAEGADACAWAYHLAPHHARHRDTLLRILEEWERDLFRRLPPPVPALTIERDADETLLIPGAIGEKMMHLQVLEDLSQTPLFQAAYRQPIRRAPETGLPYGVPAKIHVKHCDQSRRDWSERNSLRHE